MRLRTTLAAALAAALSAAPAAAQDTQDADTLEVPNRMQTLSIQPLHLAFGLIAADYERVIGRTMTASIGASYLSSPALDDADIGYSSIDAKLRYYPSGDPLNGMSFGVTAGPTFVKGGVDYEGEPEDDISALGLGFEIARSHLLGVDRRFTYSYGGGFKRLFMVSSSDNDPQLTVPIARFSVGYAF